MSQSIFTPAGGLIARSRPEQPFQTGRFLAPAIDRLVIYYNIGYPEWFLVSTRRAFASPLPPPDDVRRHEPALRVGVHVREGARPLLQRGAGGGRDALPVTVGLPLRRVLLVEGGVERGGHGLVHPRRFGEVVQTRLLHLHHAPEVLQQRRPPGLAH